MKAGKGRKTMDNGVKNLSLCQEAFMTPAKYKKVNMLPDSDTAHIKKLISILNITRTRIVS
jgi:hypothetical protein